MPMMEMNMTTDSPMSMSMDMHVFIHMGVKELVLCYHTVNAIQLFGSCLLVGFFGFAFETLKDSRQILRVYQNRKSCQHCETTPLVSKQLCNRYHYLQTVCYFFQIAFAYLVMLSIMTYNFWICLSAVLGHSLGFFALAWYKPHQMSLSPACQ